MRECTFHPSLPNLPSCLLSPLASAEDSQLPNAEERPPEPAYIASGRLPLHQQAVLLEAWQFVSRFGEPLLGFPPGSQLPTLQQLEASLLGEEPPAPPKDPEAEAAGEGAAAAEAAAPMDAAVQLQIALVEFLVAGLFQSTAQTIIGETDSGRGGMGW